MSPLRAQVEKGRQVLDELTTLPEATVVGLVADDGDHDVIGDAFRTTLDLFDTGIDLMRQNLRRSHPETSDENIERLLREWLHERPGAEFGDCPGRSVDRLA